MATDSYSYPKNTGYLAQLVADNGTDPLTFLLVSGYVRSSAHEFASDVTGELAGSGYTRVVGDGVAWATDDEESTLTVDDPTFATFTATGIDGVIGFFDTGSDATSRLAFYMQIPSIDVTGEPLTIDLPADGALVLTDIYPTFGVTIDGGIIG